MHFENTKLFIQTYFLLKLIFTVYLPIFRFFFYTDTEIEANI